MLWRVKAETHMELSVYVLVITRLIIYFTLYWECENKWECEGLCGISATQWEQNV